MRGATVSDGVETHQAIISTPAPCEECDSRPRSQAVRSIISTPAPCEGCDAMLYEMTNNKNEFQLPHPVRGATVTSDGHALAGGNFNSRTL